MKNFIFILPLVCALLASCGSYKELGYGPFERNLGGGNELRISTYPAGFPTETAHTPYVSSTTESADYVYLQIHVRDAKAKLGPNANIKNITIHSFACQLNDGKWVTLIEDYDQGFWMQGNPNYDKSDFKPLPWFKNGKVNFRIDFTLNGKREQLNGVMPAGEKSSTYPLFLRKKGV